MEAFDSRLKTGDVVSVSQVFSRLIQLIQARTLDIESPEFKFLKDKCFSSKPSIRIAASEAILTISRNTSSPLLKSLIADLISLITVKKCPPEFAFLLNNLIIIDVENELAENGWFTSVFNLRVPQHPLIIMLNEDFSCWSAVFKEISNAFLMGGKITEHFNAIYRPLFLFSLCSPQGRTLGTFNQKLWTFIVKQENAELIYFLMSWMPFESRDTICENSDYLVELSESNAAKNCIDHDLLFLWQIAVVYQLILAQSDPRDAIHGLLLMLSNDHYTFQEAVLKISLLISVKSIFSCPCVYLKQLLELCKTMVQRTQCDNIIKQIIKSALLPWIANSSVLTSDAIKIANEIFFTLEKLPKAKNIPPLEISSLECLLHTNSDVYLSSHISLLLKNWNTDTDVLSWLEKIKKTPIHFVMKVRELLYGLFLCAFGDKIINSIAFELIIECMKSDPALAPNILTLTLYKLTRSTDPQLHYQMLKAIPTMAVSRAITPKIVATIQALSSGHGTLKTFSASLMLDLWKIDNKCYPHLEKILLNQYESGGDRWEFYVTRAHILKQVCAEKSELYGKEMVAHLSRLLNECNNADGALPSALAIEGITLLCKFEVIDAVTTWATLEPMLKQENRVTVIKSICSLISEIPSLSYADAYPKLLEDIVAKLWDYIIQNNTAEVWEAALTAMTSFPLDQIVAQMPEEFLEEDILNMRQDGLVVPAQCWITFLKNCDLEKLKIAGDFLIKMVSLEISNYLKSVYQVKSTREPANHSYLPVNSIVRGLSTYIKSKTSKWKHELYKEVYIECLRIFSQEYVRPLPPLDWCFLQEVFHEDEVREFCVKIAAHQVILSGTARRFIVNYIEAVIENHSQEADIINIYSNLKYLANSVQPFTLKPFFEITIVEGVELFQKGQKDRLCVILKYIEEMMRAEDVQEANKSVIADVISVIYSEADMESELFNVLLNCIILFPVKDIDNITSLKDITDDGLKKVIKTRCHLAINTTKSPLNVLSDIIETGHDHIKIREFLNKDLLGVFEKHKDNTECVLWFLELIGQMQAVAAEKCDKKKILFMCDIFVLATVVFSGFSVFLKDLADDELRSLFPRALAALLDINHWSICTNQTLDWVYYMHSEEVLQEYGLVFLRCLQALRHEPEFYKNMKWTKYLNVAC